MSFLDPDSWHCQSCHTNDSNTSSLVNKIAHAIEPWKQSPEKPPFTDQQMMVIALVLIGGYQEIERVVDWCIKNFLCFRLLSQPPHPAVSSQGHDGMYQASMGGQVRLLTKAFEREVWQYESSLQSRTEHGRTFYSVSQLDAERILLPLVRTQTTLKRQSFFDLPAEVRNSIYEYIFQFPRSGVFVARPAKGHPWRGYSETSWPMMVLSRDVDEEFDYIRWRNVKWDGGTLGWSPHCASNDRLFRTRPIKDILAPVLSCQQFHQEAMSLFYGLNRFHFPDLTRMSKAVLALAPSRRCYIAHLSMGLHFCHGVDVDRAFRLLQNLSRLRMLSLSISEGCFLGPNWVSCPYEDPMLRLCRRLLSLCALEEVRFHGNLTNFRPVIEPRMTKQDIRVAVEKHVRVQIGMEKSG